METMLADTRAVDLELVVDCRITGEEDTTGVASSRVVVKLPEQVWRIEGFRMKSARRRTRNVKRRRESFGPEEVTVREGGINKTRG